MTSQVPLDKIESISLCTSSLHKLALREEYASSWFLECHPQGTQCSYLQKTLQSFVSYSFEQHYSVILLMILHMRFLNVLYQNKLLMGYYRFMNR